MRSRRSRSGCDRSSATAWAAIASPRPDRVDAFVGLALDADAVGVDAERVGDGSRASRRRSRASFGRSSDDRRRRRCRPRSPCSRDDAPPRARSRSRLDASFHRGSVSGKCRPMSPSRRGAENRVGHGVAHDVGVRVAEQPALERNRRRRRESADGPRRADAGRSRCRRAPARRRRRRAARSPRPPRRSSGVVILMFVASPSTSRTGWPARSASVASSVASTPRVAERQRVAQHVAAERLRRLREKDRLARQRLARRSRRRRVRARARFTVSRAGSAASAAPDLGRRGNRARRSRSARRERPRRVVDDDDVGSRRSTAANAFATESCRRAPPATTRSGFGAPRRYGGGSAASSAGSATTISSIVGMRRETAATLRSRIGRPPIDEQLLGHATPPNRWPRPPAAMMAVTCT